MEINNKKGFTLVETVVYAAGLILLIGTMVGFMYYMYNWYQYATVSSKVDQIGLILMDRIVRDIRSGKDINLSLSSFNSPNGSLYINSRDNGVNTTKKFSVSNERVQYEYDSGAAQYLTPENMSVTKLQFTNIGTLVSQAVRVEFQISYNTRSGPVTHDFSGLAIMRQSYK